MTDSDYLKSVKTAYFNYPTWANPHISKDWLLERRAIMIAQGREDEFHREYGARRVRGGARSLLPMFDDSHVLGHQDLLLKIKKDFKKLEFHTVADPGSATVFAVLFAAVNPYTREVYILDEIYETEIKNTSTSLIMPRILEIEAQIGSEDYQRTYDEAATWFMSESVQTFNVGWSPTRKSELGKIGEDKPGLSLQKDQLHFRKFWLSDRCKNFKKEILNYTKDKNGKIPKKNDHLLDCWRYLNQAAGLDLLPVSEPPPSNVPDYDPPRPKRNTLMEDFNDDWFI